MLFDIASDYNKGIAEIFRDRFAAAGGTIVAFESYTTGDRDFSSQLTNIRQANPDVLFLPNYYSEVPLQVQQARRLGYTGHIVGSDSWGNEEIIALGGSVMEGLFFSTHYAPDIATPVARQFIEAYQARYGSRAGRRGRVDVRLVRAAVPGDPRSRTTRPGSDSGSVGLHYATLKASPAR